MEWVDGLNLRQALEQRGPMPDHVLSAVVVQVLAALRFVHRQTQGSYRDITHSNILIGRLYSYGAI